MHVKYGVRGGREILLAHIQRPRRLAQKVDLDDVDFRGGSPQASFDTAYSEVRDPCSKG